MRAVTRWRARWSAPRRAKPAGGVSERPGMGLAATIDGYEIRLGSRAWCGIDETTAIPGAGRGRDLAASRMRAGGRGSGFRDQLRSDAVRGRGVEADRLSHRVAVRRPRAGVRAMAFRLGIAGGRRAAARRE